MQLDAALASFVLSVLPEGGWTLVPLAADHNLVVRARDGSTDIVVRIQPVRRMSEAAAAALVAYLTALSCEPELRVPRPLPLRDGRWFADVIHDGAPRRCSLVTWVPGERASTARAFVEPSRLLSVAAAVARMHACAERLPPTATKPVPRLDARALFGPGSCLESTLLHERLGKALLADLRRAAQVMAGCIEKHLCSRQGVGLVHADLEPQNWVFEDGRPGVIDFDEFRHGPFSLDLLGVLWTHAMWDDYADLREVLFAGYEHVRTLPPRTREDADVLMAFLFFQWLQFVHGEDSGEGLARHASHFLPMAERIVAWCGG